MKHALTILLLLYCMLLGGCVAPGMPPVNVEKLSYAQLAAKYNANLARVDRLWARTVVEIQWLDGKKKKFEQGEGHLILMLPNQVAFDIGKVGSVMMWAGSDDLRYWLMDLRDRHVAYVGTHANAGRLSVDDLPVPVQPLELVRLLGVVPIDPDADRSPAPVRWADGCYVVSPPGQHCTLWINPTDFHASRIDLLNDEGGPRVSCVLTRFETIEIEHQPPGAWPKIATKLAITVAAHGRASEAKMSVFLSDLTDGREDEKIREQAFDFDALRKMFKVDDVVDLDAKID
jgi:hypothetical protein